MRKKYDFDTVTDRKHTGSLKWLATQHSEAAESAFPLSMADMEWGTAPEIRKACADFAMNGFYTYTGPDERYLNAVCGFMSRRHSWEISPEWITPTYGIVSAIHTCVRAFTEKGDGVIIQKPVYGHFESAVTLNGRKAVNNALKIKDGRYVMDLDLLEKQCSDKNNKLLVLCSPHNPVGRVWDREELERLAEICVKYDLTVISDEIHFDIVAKEHTVLATLNGEIAKRTITCTAPSKSFNIAGLGTSHIIISDEKLRSIFRERLEKDGYECINAFAYPAVTAAYTLCDDWLDEMNARLRHNWDITKSFINENIPEIGLYELEGTYLVWLDVSCLNIPDDKTVDFFAENAGIIPNSGGWFGDEGLGFIRLNIAVPEKILTDALNRLKKMFDEKYR